MFYYFKAAPKIISTYKIINYYLASVAQLVKRLTSYQGFVCSSLTGGSFFINLLGFISYPKGFFLHIFSMAPRFRAKGGVDHSCLVKTALAYSFNLTWSHSAELLGLRENPYLMTFLVHN